ncbi:Flavin-dependent monooxygenase, oxygenase subunit HsaA [Streptomyces sp. ADI98-12]|nr:Flavin-dependent monooxygenase, oxygenase subunit HsaA [Streptomyces sp. ADI98-12]
MTNPVLEAVEARAGELSALGPANEALGRLDDRAAEILRDVGAIRMLQPKKYGGLELHPREFAETVMRIAACDGAAGWVAGVVGVHPWEMAMADPRVQDEVWGEDQDTWIASPYAPMGLLRPVDGGYVFNGHWQFSSGTDHCEWIFLGGFLADADGERLSPPRSVHVILPRADYEIVEDSWDVVGLRGTGSKDIVVRDAFVPGYRVIEYHKVVDGSLAAEAGLTNPAYRLPFSAAFPLGITAALIGMCEGALAHHLAHQRGRVQITARPCGTTRTSCTRSATRRRRSPPRVPRCCRTSPRSTTWSPPGRRSPSSAGLSAGASRPPPPGAPPERWTRSWPAPAATPCGSTTRSSASGATCTWASRTPSTCRGRSSTPPR